MKQDKDPTNKIQRIQKSLASQQGGTQFVGVPGEVQENIPSNSGEGQELDLTRGDMRDGPQYYTPGEWEQRDFDATDNSTPEGDDHGGLGFVI